MSASRPAPPDTAAYARRIERTMQRLAGRAIVFSPRDWDLARRWSEAGVPVGLVVELLEERGARVERGLGTIAAAVDEAWRLVREGRIVRPADGERDDAPARGDARTDRAELLASAARRLGPPLGAHLARAAERVRAGGALAEIDADLDRALLDASDEEGRARLERVGQRRLAAVRGRMPPPEWRRALERSVVDAIRAEIGLPPTHAN